jgi:hypothetical protein
MTITCEYKTGGAVCGKILSCQSSLRRHIKSTHEKIKTHACVVDGEQHFSPQRFGNMSKKMPMLNLLLNNIAIN